MVTDRNHLTNWKEILIMRQWIKLDGLKRVTISGVSITYSLSKISPKNQCHYFTQHANSKPISVLETTKTSQLTRIEKALVKNSLSSNLINYEVIQYEACALIPPWYIIIIFCRVRSQMTLLGLQAFINLTTA